MNSQESKKPKQKKSQRRLVTILKVAGYVLMWLFVWSCVAIALAIGSLIIAQGVIPKEADGIAYMTARQANNIVLVIILIIATIFFGFVWLLRKKKSLSYRVSRMTLLVCTIIGLLVGVPLSLMDVWEPDDAQQNQAQQVDTAKDVKRYQYMLCSDGSYRHYTDEQMKDSRAGFTKDSEDYCKKDGQGAMSKLSDSPPEAKKSETNQVVSDPGWRVKYQESIERDNKYKECNNAWSRYYEEPKQSLQYSLGGKPSDASFYLYVGTSGQDDRAVAEYNAKARQWNTSLKGYEESFNAATIGKECNIISALRGYDYDKVRVYSNY